MAVFAVLAFGRGDPDDVWATPGEWIGSSLITSDPELLPRFTRPCSIATSSNLPSDGSAQHLMLASDNDARASVNFLPANRLNSHPHWFNYIPVKDVEKATEMLVALGGGVLISSRPDRHGGKVAVAAGPLVRTQVHMLTDPRPHPDLDSFAFRRFAIALR